MTDDPRPRQGRGERRRPRADRWLAALVALGCGAGAPPPSPASSPTDRPRDAPAPLVSPPVEPEPAPVVKPRTFIAEPMGTSPKLEVAEDARLFRRADDRGEWVMPKDLADPGQVARRLGDATVKPQERHNQILLGAAKVAKLVPVTDHAPFTVSIDTADLVTGLGARVGQSFDQLLALVPALKCSPEFGEDYQQLNCDTPDGWTAIFPSKGHDFAKLEWTGTSEQARGLIGRNRLEMLSWSGRPSP